MNLWVVIALVAAVLGLEVFVFGVGPIFWGSIVIGMIVVVFTQQLKRR